MKKLLLLALAMPIFLSCSQDSDLQDVSNTSTVVNQSQTKAVSDAVELYRYRTTSGKYEYTTNVKDLSGSVSSEILGRIYLTQEVNTVPIYNCYHAQTGGRVLTANMDEIKYSFTGGWSSQGIIGYAYSENCPREVISLTVPLIRVPLYFDPDDDMNRFNEYVIFYMLRK